MSKILIFTNRLVIGGPSTHIYLLIKELQKDHDVVLIGGEPLDGEMYDQNLLHKLINPPIILKKFSRRFHLLSDIRSFFKVMEIMKSFKPDILHTHTAKPGLVGRFIAKLFGVKQIVHTYHGFLFEHYFSSFTNFLYINLEKYLCTISDKIIVLSQLQFNELIHKRKLCKAEKVTIVPLGIEYDISEKNYIEIRNSFRRKFQLDENSMAIGIVGRLTKIKNLELFVDAMVSLIRKNYPIKVFIIGDGEEKDRIIERIEKYGHTYSDLTKEFKSETFNFTSWYFPILEVYPGLDIVVSTSVSEGTPLSLIEAQMSGKVVISTNVGGVEDILINEETGIIVPSQDKESLVSALEYLLNDKNKCIEMGNKARDFASTTFSSDVMLQNIKNIYFK